MLRTLTIAAASAALAACASVPDAPGTTPALSLETMQEVTRKLSSDAYEGRAPGTPGEDKTMAYLVEQFAAAGLQPGNAGSWFQDVPLVEITAGNVAPLTVANPAGGEPLSYEYGPQWVGATYREEERIALADSELVFVGYGIVAPEKGWNDYEGVDMRGKTAVILVNDPDYRSDTTQGTFNGRAMTYYGRWTYKYEEAARQGAAAALIVHDTFPASYGWGTVESSWSGPQLYARRPDGGADQTLLNAWLQKPVAQAMLAAAGRDLAELSAAAERPGFRAVPLGLTVSTRFDNAIRKFASKNVVAILPGSERADEYVLHTAHWDHIGRCTPDAGGDDICNGAIDNATGTAGLVALGKAHAAAGPTARTQVFLAVTAEESGLLGSEYYGLNPVFPLASTVGGVNMDALYPMGAARNVNTIGGGKSALDAVLTQALAETGRVASPDTNPEAGRYYRSDHFSLAKRGVPMLYIKQGDDLVEGGTAAGAAWHQRYNSQAYHGPADEYDSSWNWDGVMQDLAIYYRIGRVLGESADWPNWLPEDEFRAQRDASCASSEKGC